MNLRAAAALPMAAAAAPLPPADAATMMTPEGRGQAPDRSATACRLGEQFVRALRGQGADADEDSATATPAAPAAPATPAAPDAAAAGLTPWPPAASPPPMTMSAAPIAAAGDHAACRAASAAQQARDAAPAAPVVVAGLEPDGVWELSLNDPDGLVLSLRAERPAALQPAGAPPAPWLLTLVTPGAEAAAALQQHAPRLAERLAARALAPAHLRIDGARQPPGGRDEHAD